MNVFRALLIIAALFIVYAFARIVILKTKSSVNLEGLSWRMFWAALKAEIVLTSYGAELVITSALDGKHMDGSLHYKGLAIDVRSRDVSGREPSIARDLRAALGSDYDVVIEPDHFHIEYDPKTEIA